MKQLSRLHLAAIFSLFTILTSCYTDVDLQPNSRNLSGTNSNFNNNAMGDIGGINVKVAPIEYNISMTLYNGSEDENPLQFWSEDGSGLITATDIPVGIYTAVFRSDPTLVLHQTTEITIQNVQVNANVITDLGTIIFD
jgi:hypothetical protein